LAGTAVTEIELEETVLVIPAHSRADEAEVGDTAAMRFAAASWERMNDPELLSVDFGSVMVKLANGLWTTHLR
jgi:hypothetical protein